MGGACNIHVFKKKIRSGIEIPTANIANAAANTIPTNKDVVQIKVSRMVARDVAILGTQALRHPPKLWPLELLSRSEHPLSCRIIHNEKMLC